MRLFHIGLCLLFSALVSPSAAYPGLNITTGILTTGFLDCLPPSPKILEPYLPDCEIALWMMTKDPYFRIQRNYAHITYKPPPGSHPPPIERRTPLTWLHATCKIIVDTEDPYLIEAWEVQSAWRRASEIFKHCLHSHAGMKSSVGGLAPLGNHGFEVLLRGRNFALVESM